MGEAETNEGACACERCGGTVAELSVERSSTGTRMQNAYACVCGRVWTCVDVVWYVCARMCACVCVCVCACVARLSAAVLPPSPPPCELLCAAEAICVRARRWPGPRPEQSDGACPASSVRARVCGGSLSSLPLSSQIPGCVRLGPGYVSGHARHGHA